MKLKKLNEHGDYTLYPGITIVAHALESDSPFWTKIFELLSSNERLKSFYAPLPKTSYHMTAINLYTKASIGQNIWKSFVAENMPFLRMLHQKLQEQVFSPKIVISHFKVTSSISFSITLAEEHRQLIASLADEYNVARGIPFRFHITLAYLYKPVSFFTQRKIASELNSLLVPVLQEYGDSFFLNSPKLCYFEDMLEFVPWDASFFPFKEREISSPSQNSLFSTSASDEELEETSALPCIIL